MAARNIAVVVMGVAGSGKSSVGERLARRLGLPFRDADEFHPPANIAKMTAGVPLEDADRWPWLEAIGDAIRDSGDGLVVACSALRRVYRDRILARAGRPVTFVYLDGDKRTIGARLGSRKGHFMPPSLLDSQFATLEPPGADEPAVSVSVALPLDAVVDAAIAKLNLGQPA